MKILSCANADTIHKSNRKDEENINLMCECSFDYNQETSDNLPKYSFCKIMRFKNKNSRKTCYELLPLNQKTEFHSRIVNYFENNKQKCSDCGGTILIVQSTSNLYIEEFFISSRTSTETQNSADSDHNDDDSIDEDFLGK